MDKTKASSPIHLKGFVPEVIAISAGIFLGGENQTAVLLLRAVLLLWPAISILLTRDKGNNVYKVILSLFWLVEGFGKALLPYRHYAKAVVVFIPVAVILTVLVFKGGESLQANVNAFLNLLMLSLMYFISLIRLFGSFTYVPDTFFAFGWISFAIGAGVLVTFVAKLYPSIKKTHSGFKGTLLTVFCLAMILLMLTFLADSWLKCINYAFDSGMTETYVVDITDKEINSHRRGPDTYEFEYVINGEKHDIEVPFRVYQSYDVGDPFKLYKFKGALGKTFYTWR